MNNSMKKPMKTKPKILWKFLRIGLKSDGGKHCQWRLGEWRKESDIKICDEGFHCSQTPLQALGYVKGEILAQVEVRGESIVESDKECWSEMRIVKAWHWTKEDSVSLAIYAAEQVIDIYEKKYPNDGRPRKAIEAAKKWLKNPTADAADAANAADAAAYAANAAAYAADAAARARKELTKKINIWFAKRIKTLARLNPLISSLTF